jgi:hypothetical protein
MVLMMVFKCKNLKVCSLSGRYITIEYHKDYDGNAYLSEILCVFIDNCDGYDLLLNQFDNIDTVVEGMDDI